MKRVTRFSSSLIIRFRYSFICTKTLKI